MATYTRTILANLLDSGLAGTLAYTVMGPDGTPLVARTTAGITEDGGSAIYTAAVAGWDAAWSGRVVWDAGAGTLAAEAFQSRTGYALAANGLDAVPVESGVNARQALSAIGAAAAGVVAGMDAGSPVFRALNNPGTVRISGAADEDGNRTAVTLNLPA